jgi:hypothetical protein
MAKSKSRGSRPAPAVRGGASSGEGGSAGTQKPGQSASMGRGGGKFAKGGSTGMFPYSGSKPSKKK